MRLRDALREYGLNVNDIKDRVQQNQIFINGEKTNNEDIVIGNIKSIYDEGFFLQKLYKQSFYENFKNQLLFFGVENLIDSNIENELTNFLSNFLLVKIKKDKSIFIELTKNENNQISFFIDGIGNFSKNIPKSNGIDIEKLKKDKEKVEKQLANQNFINKAPRFKIEAAKKRLIKLNNRLIEIVK